MGRRSRVLPREICLLAHETECEKRREGDPSISSRPVEDARSSTRNEQACDALWAWAREVERPTTGRQKSAEAKVAATHAANGPNMRSRTGTEFSMREEDADKRAEKPERPCGAGGGTAKARGPERQTGTANEEDTGDEARKLIEEVLRRENIKAAHDRVVQNGGAPGIDGMTVDALMTYCREHWAQIRQKLLDGTYMPEPVRKVEIPKPGGKGMRMLGIPTVLDRMIQQAVLQVLQPIFDPTFSDGSFGFRPGRSTQGAVTRAREHIASGHRWLVDLDLEQFFDRVNHDVLMARVARRVKDKRVLLLIRRYLQAGLMEGGLVSPRAEGTPQGGPLSPLLSNVLLDELDKELEHRGHRFVRYADDCNVYVQSKAAGERVMASLERFLRERLRLKVNRDKSAVARPWERKFLGYTVTSNLQPKLKVAAQSIQRLRSKLRPIWRRGRGREIASTIEELNPIIRGWVAYYRMVVVTGSLQELDAWIRRKLRCLVWRQWKTPGTRLRKLRERGLNSAKAHAGAMNSRGPWWNAGSTHMNLALPNDAFTKMGLVSFLAEHQRLARTS
jgi:RNA-directed DNA polymerase